MVNLIVTREMQIKTTMRNLYMSLKMVNIHTKLLISITGKELSYITGDSHSRK
jgi:hypothetical protein